MTENKAATFNVGDPVIVHWINKTQWKGELVKIFADHCHVRDTQTGTNFFGSIFIVENTSIQKIEKKEKTN